MVFPNKRKACEVKDVEKLLRFGTRTGATLGAGQTTGGMLDREFVSMMKESCLAHVALVAVGDEVVSHPPEAIMLVDITVLA